MGPGDDNDTEEDWLARCLMTKMLAKKDNSDSPLSQAVARRLKNTHSLHLKTYE